MSLPLIKVQKPNFQLGQIIGSKLKHRIQHAVQETLDNLLASGITCQSLKEQQAPFVEEIARELPHLLNELNELASMADVPFEGVFFLNSGGYRGPGTGSDRRQTDQRPNHCTSIASCGDGFVVVGHNEDAAPDCIDDIFVLDATVPARSVCRCEDEVRFISLCYAYTLPGCSVTRNSHGLLIMVDTLEDPDPHVGVPCDFLTRAVVEQPSIDAVIHFLRAIRRHGAASLLLVQNERLVNIEITSTELAIHEITGPVGYAHTNHFRDRKLAATATSGTGSVARLERALQLVRPNLTVEEMKLLLADRTGFPDSICRERTLASIVARTDKLGLEICFGEPHGGIWGWYEF